MADLTITGTAVAPVATGTTPTFSNKVIQLGATCTGGEPLYLQNDGKWYLAVANGTAIQAGSLGLRIAATAGTAGQWIVGLGAGDITIGTGTVGVMYVVSAANAGKIAPISDLASTNRVSFLGQVTSTGVLSFNPVIGTPLA